MEDAARQQIGGEDTTVDPRVADSVIASTKDSWVYHWVSQRTRTHLTFRPTTDEVVVVHIMDGKELCESPRAAWRVLDVIHRDAVDLFIVACRKYGFPLDDLRFIPMGHPMVEDVAMSAWTDMYITDFNSGKGRKVKQLINASNRALRAQLRKDVLDVQARTMQANQGTVVHTEAGDSEDEDEDDGTEDEDEDEDEDDILHSKTLQGAMARLDFDRRTALAIPEDLRSPDTCTGITLVTVPPMPDSGVPMGIVYFLRALAPEDMFDPERTVRQHRNSGRITHSVDSQYMNDSPCTTWIHQHRDFIGFMYDVSSIYVLDDVPLYCKRVINTRFTFKVSSEKGAQEHFDSVAARTMDASAPERDDVAVRSNVKSMRATRALLDLVVPVEA